MSRRDDDRERDRPSWRDIDRRKDTSSHIDRTDPYKKKTRGQKADASPQGYRSALDRLFEGGELPERYKGLAKAKESMAKGEGSERQNILRRLRSAVGQTEVAEAITEILKLDGALPRERDALLSALLHPDESVVRSAIALLKELVVERPIKRSDLLRQRLRKIEDLAEEPETATAATELRHMIT